MSMSKRGTACAVLAIAAAAAGPASANAAGRAAVKGSVPAWATHGRDRGAVDGSQQRTISVYLGLRDEAGAEALAQQVSDPASAQYRRYLTPAQFTQRFGATDDDVAAVAKFLRAAGLSVSVDKSDNRLVQATGRLDDIESAFATSIHDYLFRGKVVQAPAVDLSVPASLSGSIQAVGGLSQTLTSPLGDTGAGPAVRPDAPAKPPKKGDPGAVPPPAAFVNAPPCSRYFGEKPAADQPPYQGQTLPYVPCGYTPSQYQGAYGLSGLGLDGHGYTVAITDAYAASTILQDANTYATRHGQQPFADGQFTQLDAKKFREGYNDAKNGDVCGEQGWYGEETLDVEAVHAIAPGANVLYAGAASCEDSDLLDALHSIIGKHRADVITNSWGDVGEDASKATLKAYHDEFLQAAGEGIAVFFSSGDDGDDSGDTADGSPAVDFPSSEPLVTAVGGTSLGVTASNGYGFETGWATGTATRENNTWPAPTWLYGGGGGVSSLFPEPGYQQGVVPDSIANGHRATPDIAMDGDPQTGMLVGETQTFSDGSVRYSEYRLGGTSLSSPLMAGVYALADQGSGRSLGFANPGIYRLAGTPVFHDVSGPAPVPGVVRINYNNSEDASEGLTAVLRTLDQEDQSLHVAPGWDDLTGVGTPNGSAFTASQG